MLNLSAPSSNLVIADTERRPGTIVNDDGTPGTNPFRTFAVGNASVVEGNSGTTITNFTVSLSAKPPVGQTRAVKVATGERHRHCRQRLHRGGADHAHVDVHRLAHQDRGSRSHRRRDQGRQRDFHVEPHGPTNAGLADGSGLATIIDEEGQLFVSINDVASTRATTAPRR